MSCYSSRLLLVAICAPTCASAASGLALSDQISTADSTRSSDNDPLPGPPRGGSAVHTHSQSAVVLPSRQGGVALHQDESFPPVRGVAVRHAPPPPLPLMRVLQREETGGCQRAQMMSPPHPRPRSAHAKDIDLPRRLPGTSPFRGATWQTGSLRERRLTHEATDGRNQQKKEEGDLRRQLISSDKMRITRLQSSSDPGEGAHCQFDLFHALLTNEMKANDAVPLITCLILTSCCLLLDECEQQVDHSVSAENSSLLLLLLLETRMTRAGGEKDAVVPFGLGLKSSEGWVEIFCLSPEAPVSLFVFFQIHEVNVTFDH
ncbi:unnamed protein product [Pleuronectes platessa]|uniref:Secreted protein n=1 Tax=Pleuronectes platessa TaxID=8262 RepID=A0A9N7VNN5_PLEPL|nr:unnamed protein product [Pleuronectes platessa]